MTLKEDLRRLSSEYAEKERRLAEDMPEEWNRPGRGEYKAAERVALARELAQKAGEIVRRHRMQDEARDKQDK